MKNTKEIILLCFLLSTSYTLLAQKNTKNFWQQIEKTAKLPPENILLGEIPDNYLIQELDIKALSKHLEQVSDHDAEGLKENPTLINIPTPNGAFEAFYIFQNTVVATEVAHLYTIKTFQGYAKDDPSIPIRCDVSENGFHAVVFNGNKTYAIKLNETVLALCGTVPIEDNAGRVWMLGTGGINNNYRLFLRGCKQAIDILQGKYDTIENSVPEDHTDTIMWLSWCGFVFDAQKYNIHGHNMMRFVRCRKPESNVYYLERPVMH